METAYFLQKAIGWFLRELSGDNWCVLYRHHRGSVELALGIRFTSTSLALLWHLPNKCASAGDRTSWVGWQERRGRQKTEKDNALGGWTTWSLGESEDGGNGGGW